MACEYEEIPPRLHREGRNIIPEFLSEEYLYRRGDFGKELAYSGISLAHISVNRSGRQEWLLSQPDDVRHYIQDGEYRFDNGPITTMTLEDSPLTNGSGVNYEEEFDNQGNVESVVAVMQLRHEPEECNFSHSTFVFIYQGQEMIALPKEVANYGTNLGRRAKYVSRIRQSIRDDIDKLIVD
ncbi:MAG: hypothetical protein KDC12_04920 [Flavobacteriales bacterium]|nr:hypothetical protein [Flavobacteriales bacterium]